MTQLVDNTKDFSMLLAASVHDLKNILNVSLESLDWLNTTITTLNTEQQYEFSKIKRLLANVNSELMQLLCFYKFDQKQYAMSCTEHNVLECLEAQALFIGSLIRVDQLQISIVCSADLNWEFDLTLVNTAIRNAAMNAIKYAKNMLVFSAKNIDNFLVLEVIDDGAGFPETMLVDQDVAVSSVDFVNNSTGLGLYFAKKVAALHTKNKRQGYLELANSSNLGGACFKLYLP